ncbi:hypothetical protein [Arcanobacterium hippocoleae]|uniref:hypothetical protein n=1 Tax=Arcanobacterium hippocoleae TaxID=149017 RepID=UPI0033418987
MSKTKKITALLFASILALGACSAGDKAQNDAKNADGTVTITIGATPYHMSKFSNLYQRSLQRMPESNLISKPTPIMYSQM